MSNLTPSTNSLTHTSLGAGGVSRRPFGSVDRRTARELTSIERQTLTRIASVRGHTLVQAEKVNEIDRLTREAMSGQAMLTRWSQTLAQGDPFITDDLKFFTDIAKMAKGEIIADTVSSFSQEGR